MEPGDRWRVAPRDALHRPLLAGDADAPSCRTEPIDTGRRRVHGGRRVLRGGSKLADAAASARTASGPAARRITCIRERLTVEFARNRISGRPTRLRAEGRV